MPTCLVTVRYQNGQTLSFELTQPSNYIGRSQGNDICLPHAFIAPRHLRVRLVPEGRFTLTDLGSTSGTMIDGEPLEPHVEVDVREGGQVTIGPILLTLTSLVDAKPVDLSGSSSWHGGATSLREESSTAIGEATLRLLQEELTRAQQVETPAETVAPLGDAALGVGQPAAALPAAKARTEAARAGETPTEASGAGALHPSTWATQPPAPPRGGDTPWMRIFGLFGGFLVFAALALIIAVLIV
ncbi:MAG: FHA domain-containing protein [Acidobacteriota bacterium]